MTQLWIILGYLALLLILGLFASRFFRGTSSDYMVASHTIGPFLLLMSIFGTTMTAFALVGSSGEAYEEGIGVYGMLASSSGIIHSLCFFVLGIKLWGFGKRYGYRTQIQFFRERLESSGIGLLLFPILVGLVIPYLLIGVISSGVVIQNMTAGAFPKLFATESPATSGGIPTQWGSLLICLVVLIYVFLGGMRGTAWANAFQTMVFMLLGIVTFGVIANKLGGQASLWENLRVLGEAIPAEKATRTDMSKMKFFSYLLVPLSVGMFPHLFQHWLTAKSAKSFKLPVIAHPVFIMIVWVPCVLIGVWATSELVTIPPALRSRPNAILPFLVNSQAGPVLGGFLTAGILAAIMSSLDSQFLCLGTMFTHDIMGHYFDHEATDRRELALARGFIVIIVVITYLLSLLKPPSVFALGVWTFSGFSALTPLAFAALYWKRLTKWGAYASVLAAAASWGYFFSDAVGKAVQAGNPEPIRTYSLEVTLGGETYEVMSVAAIFLASVIAMVLVSLVTKPPGEETLKKFFS
ncbi:MAG: sodium:solute symporter family protein [Planctomycetales bacterium]|nr:sodium:solute symporter family protein [Planctomycetales bacterium]